MDFVMAFGVPKREISASKLGGSLENSTAWMSLVGWRTTSSHLTIAVGVVGVDRRDTIVNELNEFHIILY
jgi:hypothetical protein